MRTLKEIMSNYSKKKEGSKKLFAQLYKEWSDTLKRATERIEEQILENELKHIVHVKSPIEKDIIIIGQASAMLQAITNHYCRIYGVGQAEAIKDLTK